MKTIRIKELFKLLIAATAVTILAATTPTVIAAQSTTVPDAASLTDQRFHRRAVESVFWGQPVVTFWATRDALRTTFNYQLNDVVYFSKPADWKYKFLTVNNTTLYSYVFYNLEKDGPIVIEMPSTTEDVGIFGSVMNVWQQAFIDFGGQGADRGLGAKYLVLHKDYQKTIPPGYI